MEEIQGWIIGELDEEPEGASSRAIPLLLVALTGFVLLSIVASRPAYAGENEKAVTRHEMDAEEDSFSARDWDGDSDSDSDSDSYSDSDSDHRQQPQPSPSSPQPKPSSEPAQQPPKQTSNAKPAQSGSSGSAGSGGSSSQKSQAAQGAQGAPTTSQGSAGSAAEGSGAEGPERRKPSAGGGNGRGEAAARAKRSARPDDNPSALLRSPDRMDPVTSVRDLQFAQATDATFDKRVPGDPHNSVPSRALQIVLSLLGFAIASAGGGLMLRGWYERRS